MDGLAKRKYKGYKLLFKDHDKYDPKVNNIPTAVAKMKELGTKGKPYSDPVLWTAVGQIGLLNKFIARYRADSGLERRGWYYTGWGEYQGGPAYGWITGLKFKTAVEFYVKNNPGKTEEDLKKHCQAFLGNMVVQAGKAVYAQWLNGEVFE